MLPGFIYTRPNRSSTLDFDRMLSHLQLALFLQPIVPLVSGLKILVVQTVPSPSHIHFSSQLIDVLTSHGHVVVSCRTLLETTLNYYCTLSDMNCLNLGIFVRLSALESKMGWFF